MLTSLIAASVSKPIRYIFLFCLTFVLQLVSPNVQAQELGPIKNLFKINAIKVEGNRKVESEAILQKISARPGMTLDNYLLKKDIQTIYQLNYFQEVEAHKKGRDLVFKVKEKPIISKLVFTGNEELSEDEITEKIKTKAFSILDINQIKADVGEIQKMYEDKGFYLASVSYQLKPVGDEKVELNILVKEQQKVTVKSITFLGNVAFEDTQLKSIMATKEEDLFSVMSNSGNFKEFDFQMDVERVKYFYKSKGYLQINIGSPSITVSEDKKWVFITMKVTEGPKFSVNEVFYDGELLFGIDEMKESTKLMPGDVYSEDLLRKDIQKLTEMYQDQGYAFANVLRTLKIVPGENKVDIYYSFEKGKIAYFGEIRVKGNSKTRDKVVRRELRIFEGMKYSGSKLRESKENVNRLGFFKPGSVLFNTVSPPGSDDVLDVEITLEERNTGQITLGAGYSTATKGFLQASIAQQNFRGLGQNLSFSLSLASQAQTFNLGFTEPYFMDSMWSAGGDLFRQRNENRQDFSYVRQGFNIRVGYPLTFYSRMFLTYKFEDTELARIDDPTINTDLENGVASSIISSLVTDRRNNRFEPSGGYYTRFAAEYTGLGGVKKWGKLSVEGRYYKKVWEDLVLRTRFTANKLTKIGGHPIPRSEKFTLGGSRNLRGFGFQDVGPLRRYVAPDGRVWIFNNGGLFSMVGTVEFEHPLVREAGLKWVVFSDVGNVYSKMYGHNDETSLRSDWGFGFRWFSPIGVLRFEFGFPIDRRSREAANQFYFDIGQLF